jgi:hypothetical protein
MSAGRANTCHHRGPSTALAIDGIDIDGKGAIAGIDTEQCGSVLTEVVVVLHLQLVLDGVIVAGGGIWHCVPNADG